MMLAMSTALSLILALAGAAATAQPAPPSAAAFLTRNAGQPGVNLIPGVQYKVLHAGPSEGRHPTRADDITVEYEGRLLDGQMFDASKPGVPVTFELKRLIPAWITALQLMRPGDEWMLWAPPEMAYGFTDRGPVPAGSVLAFKVKLISVAPHADSPASR